MNNNTGFGRYSRDEFIKLQEKGLNWTEDLRLADLQKSRMKRITSCMDTMEELRNLKKEDDYPFGRELAEADTLEELHRLLYGNS